MNDLRLPGLHNLGLPSGRSEPAASPARAPAEPDPSSFDRVLQRSTDARSQPEFERDRVRHGQRHTERQAGPGIDEARAADGASEPKRSGERIESAQRDRQRIASNDDAVDQAQGDGAALRVPATGARIAAKGDRTAQPADAACVDSTTVAAGFALMPQVDVGTSADQTIDAMAALAAVDVPTATAAATMDGQAAVMNPLPLAVAVAPTEAPDAAPGAADPGVRAAATAPDIAAARAVNGVIAPTTAGTAAIDAKASETDAASGAWPELDIEAGRTPTRDRLLEDFERRFESSLARAAGASGASPLNPSGPLAAAGLTPQTAPAPTSMTIAYAGVATPIGHPAFANDLSHRVLLFAGQRVHSAEISVTPGELGPIKVNIDMRGQEAAMQFSAAHATTRAAIEDALPRLREMLAAQGLQLTHADVSDPSQRDAGGAMGGQGSDGGSARRDGASPGRPGASSRIDAAGAGSAVARRIGLIDIRV